jgi:hypothetical protein
MEVLKDEDGAESALQIMVAYTQQLHGPAAFDIRIPTILKQLVLMWVRV